MPAVLLTRPMAGSQAFAARLRQDFPGLNVVLSPLQQVRLLPWQWPEPRPDAVIFTSANAVVAGSGTAFCVGNQTAKAAQAAGYDAISAGADAEALVQAVHSAAAPQLRLLHLRGAVSRGNVAGRLRELGHNVEERVVYETLALPLTDEAAALLAGSDPVLLPLFSPQSAVLAAAALPSPRAPLQVLCLSPAVQQAADWGFAAKIRVARRPDADAMVEIVAEALNWSGNA